VHEGLRAFGDELDRGALLVLGLPAGVLQHDPLRTISYVLCERQPNLAFFSGFHRHGALGNPGTASPPTLPSQCKSLP